MIGYEGSHGGNTAYLSKFFENDKKSYLRVSFLRSVISGFGPSEPDSFLVEIADKDQKRNALSSKNREITH